MPGLRNIMPSLKPYVINKAEDGKSAKVNLYGEIVETVPIDWWTGEKIEGLFIELKQFLDDIEGLSGMDEVSFFINSVGGDVNAGTSIYSKIRSLKAHTTTIVDGLAASAASIVAQAGDERKVSIGSQTMIHCASAGLIGYYNRDDLKAVSNTLKSFDNSIAELLADRTGREECDILNMMSKTTWMTAEEAVKEGFADEVINKSEPVVDRVSDSTMYVINGIPHSFHNMPVPSFKTVGTFAPAQITEVSNGSGPVDIDNPSKKEEKSMDIQELKNAYPDLVTQIQDEAKATAQTENAEAVKNAVNDAVKAERERMKAIDSIAKTIGAELVNEAKYGENPMNASELALKALQDQQAKGSEYMETRSKEIAASGVNNVTASPVGGSEEDTQAKDIQDGANLLLAARK
jgi:ATP-dependent Clp endopeptidase proteolytic subunit ClpP